MNAHKPDGTGKTSTATELLLANLRHGETRALARAVSLVEDGALEAVAAGDLLDVTVLDHLGIAVQSIKRSLGLYEALGIVVSGIEEVAHEQVRVAMLAVGGSRIELLEATEDDSAVGRFLAKRGEGLHHIALRVPDLAAAIEKLKALGVRLVSETIQVGAGGHRYVFVHPTSANGVLMELVESAGEGDGN